MHAYTHASSTSGSKKKTGSESSQISTIPDSGGFTLGRQSISQWTKPYPFTVPHQKLLSGEESPDFSLFLCPNHKEEEEEEEESLQIRSLDLIDRPERGVRSNPISTTRRRRRRRSILLRAEANKPASRILESSKL
jgi:hypothetical protein